MIGIRSALLTATKGTVVLDTQFDSYKPCVGIVAQREKGSLLAHEQGNRAAAVHTCVVWCWLQGGAKRAVNSTVGCSTVVLCSHHRAWLHLH
jgi:hypothetical protein